ncbi:MAG: sulfatase-like hydrolase/transferase [Terriglobales bacterium]
MRTWLFTISRMLWGVYLILTSVYCLLAFLPYTFVALIKEPPYAWVPWFAHHQAALYFLILALLLAADWPKGKTVHTFLLFGVLLFAGSYLIARPFLLALEDNWTTYGWSLISLLPLALLAIADLRSHWPANGGKSGGIALLPYSIGILIAVSTSLVYVVASALHGYIENGHLQPGAVGLELAAWSLISHVLLAILILSTLNLIRILSQRTRSTLLHLSLLGALAFGVFWVMLFHLLTSSLGFEGWAAHLYAASLAAALTLWLGSLALPLSARKTGALPARSRGFRSLLWVTIFGLSLFAVVLPTMIAGSDWDGVLQNTYTLILWVALGTCFYTLWGRRRTYSWVNILAIVLLSGIAYKSLQATQILWARPLGATDDDVRHAMDNYAARDASFRLVHDFLGGARGEACSDLCRILRENTNIRNARVSTDLELVDQLAPAHGERPNIFIFVVDSLRPDYLGAYNPKVDFTPNLDAFARDSITVHDVYTPYAGTSLSEPAIWAGSLLLHAHYLQPFARINSLEKLARTDGYRMVVSYDEILRQLLSPADDLVKLDTDKKLWNQLEVCSTIHQAEPLLEGGLGRNQPVLFYTQPKNVHQFAHNDLPLPSQDHWQNRPGFNNRIAHEVHQVDGCMGEFFRFLKGQGMYDNSIVLLTSDHGDATGEFGRSSHSLSIYPEVMRVPLIVHLPPAMRRLLYDENHLSALTDITPSLYYLLGHRPVRANPLFGHPLFVETPAELQTYQRSKLFLASDERPVYGLLLDNGRWLYTTYDSPAQSFLFDLRRDPNAQHNVLTPALKKQYDEEIIDHLQAVAGFYGYKPGIGSLLAAAH